ncbi:MAG: PASTA domain-containing protein [Bacteroidales bacterium]|nr:PASTA domain-containing protein [Bacteroidales bacterium]
MNFLRFLISKTFWIQVAIAVAAIVGLLSATTLILSAYTNKGRTIIVPSIIGRTQAEVAKELKNSDLDLVLVDSVYNLEARPGAIVDQEPAAGKKVKKGRTLYVTINAFGREMTTMPDVVSNSSDREAMAILATAGLKVGKLEHRPHPHNGLVLEAKVNGEEVKPGERIPKGTVVDLVVGEGNGNVEALVGDYKGLTLDDAGTSIRNCKLNVGRVIYDETVVTAGDTLASVVYKQSPKASDKVGVQVGMEVDLWMTMDMTKVYPAGEEE